MQSREAGRMLFASVMGRRCRCTMYPNQGASHCSQYSLDTIALRVMTGLSEFIVLEEPHQFLPCVLAHEMYTL